MAGAWNSLRSECDWSMPNALDISPTAAMRAQERGTIAEDERHLMGSELNGELS
jgi:hypothetical protein